MTRKQMSWAIIFHGYLPKKQDILYDTSKIINRQSSPNPDNFYFDTDNIRDKLTHLNIYKSPGPDGFHPRVLFEIRATANTILLLFVLENYRQTGDLQILLLYIKKIIKKNEPSNYRPISLTSIICKIMESVIRDVIVEDFLSKGFFGNNQYGFIKGRSTVLQLLKIFDDWTYKMDQGVQIDVIYTDFEKPLTKYPI